MNHTKSLIVLTLVVIALLVLAACGKRDQVTSTANAAGDVVTAAETQPEVSDEETVHVAEPETHDGNQEVIADQEKNDENCHQDAEASNGSDADASACAHDDDILHEHSHEAAELNHHEDLATAIDVEDAVADGLQLFHTLGCGGCHGMDGEGILGPAISGHTAEQIHNQVRMPVNSGQFKDANDNPIVMPAFTEDMISDEQLDLIAAWVESLGPATGEHVHMHGEHMSAAPAVDETGEADGSASAEAASHLRLAFSAIHDGELHDAGHHLAELVAGLEDGEVKEQAELILTDLGSNTDLHELEDLVGAMVPNEDSNFGARFHLQLTLDSFSLDDLDRAQHHLEHFIELASGMDKIKARETQTLLAEGDIHEASHIVEELMGMTPHADH